MKNSAAKNITPDHTTPATKADIAQLATKSELKKLATKAELKKLATKAELKKLATKEELKKFATKAELKAEVAKLATKEELKAEVAKLATKEELKAEIQILREEMNERFNDLPTREDFSTLLSSVDGLIIEVKKYNTERASETYRLDRTEQWIKKAADVIKVPFEL